MSAVRKTDLDRRLEAYFATLRSLVFKRRPKTQRRELADLCRGYRLGHGDGDKRLGIDHRQQCTEHHG
jgi:hypothetical protein